MTDAAKPLVLLRLHGIEKARFIERSGPDLITGGDWHFMLAAKIYKGDFLIKKIGLSLNIKVILTIGEDDWFRRKDGTSIRSLLEHTTPAANLYLRYCFTAKCSGSRSSNRSNRRSTGFL